MVSEVRRGTAVLALFAVLRAKIRKSDRLPAPFIAYNWVCPSQTSRSNWVVVAAGLLGIVTACRGAPPGEPRDVMRGLTESEARVVDQAMSKYIERIVWADIVATSRVLGLEADWVMDRLREVQPNGVGDFLREYVGIQDRWGNRISRDWLANGAVLVVRSSGPDANMDTGDDLIAVRWKSGK